MYRGGNYLCSQGVNETECTEEGMVCLVQWKKEGLCTEKGTIHVHRRGLGLCAQGRECLRVY